MLAQPRLNFQLKLRCLPERTVVHQYEQGNSNGLRDCEHPAAQSRHLLGPINRDVARNDRMRSFLDQIWLLDKCTYLKV